MTPDLINVIQADIERRIATLDALRNLAVNDVYILENEIGYWQMFDYRCFGTWGPLSTAERHYGLEAATIEANQRGGTPVLLSAVYAAEIADLSAAMDGLEQAKAALVKWDNNRD
jgi:hypothetical protein